MSRIVAIPLDRWQRLALIVASGYTAEWILLEDANDLASLSVAVYGMPHPNQWVTELVEAAEYQKLMTL